ncbi:MAG: hypothetical protein HOB97_00960, partial [Verrucomicrobia bacterium]|nr:hypothetical protein [Verrucomicrobiota bacterium]
MPPPMAIALKNTVARDVISASEQEAFIINVINNAIKGGKLDTGKGVNDLELDSMETSSASINKGNFKENHLQQNWLPFLFAHLSLVGVELRERWQLLSKRCFTDS